MATVATPELTAFPFPGSAAAAEISGDEFFARIDAGIVEPRPVFLSNGRILERMTKPFAHATTSVAILEALGPRLPVAPIPVADLSP